MSLFAGIYEYAVDGEPTGVPRDAVAKVIERLSRSGHEVRTHEFPRFFLAKVDIGAFRDQGFRISEQTVTAVVGEPLLEASTTTPSSRSRDLDQIVARLSSEGTAILRKCQGSYALCHYDQMADRLLVATDKLGVRPLYYHIGARHFFFSNSIRLLEALDQVPKRLDLRAVTEKAVIGYTLAERTDYVDIHVCLSGECIRVADGKCSRSRYFRLQDVAPTRLTYEEFLDAAYESFSSAIACRATRDQTVLASLSGGLDSRSVVAVLKALGKQPLTINYYRSETEADKIIADAYARRIGSHHYSEGCDWSNQCYEQHLDHRRAVQQLPPDTRPTYPKLIFAGGGGSVGVGHVYMNETIIRLLREGRTREAVTAFLNSPGLPHKLFKPDMRRRLDPLPVEGVLKELEGIQTADPGKALYFFLMENDQRRHLHELYFEVLDLQGIEQLLPFFDGQFIELLASAPVDWFLGHKFYHEWLDRCFPAETTQVPWQTYPGHLPCPVGGLEISRSQWEKPRIDRFRSSHALFSVFGESLRSHPSPSPLFRRSVLNLAHFLHKNKLVEYGYIVNTFIIYDSPYKVSKGTMLIPSLDCH